MHRIGNCWLNRVEASARTDYVMIVAEGEQWCDQCCMTFLMKVEEESVEIV